MRNPDDDPLDPLDLFLAPQPISPLSVNYDFVEAVLELGEDKAIQLLKMLKDMLT